jgi:LysR family transcriptional regulator of abg operon
MDLVQLKRFLVAAETGNLRRAATQLHVSQPALTQSIKSLEQGLGVELFERSARGVMLTACGRALVPRARMMLNERERISRDMAEIAGGDATRLAVGVAPYFSRQIFPAAALRTLQPRPTLKLDIVEHHTTQLVKLLREGEIELAFCVHNAIIDGDDALEFTPTYEERYSVMARPGHPLLRKRRVSEKDLANSAWIVHDSAATPGFLARHFERRGLAAPSWSVSTLSLPLMVSLLAKSDLVALMPEDFTRPDVAASRLRRIVGHGIEVLGQAGILLRRGAVVGASAGALIQNLRAVCAETQKSVGRRGASAPAPAVIMGHEPA